jgi:hypothetical protein
MMVIPETEDGWQLNNLLVSGWNDEEGFFGQGNNITVIRNGNVIKTLTISPNGVADTQCTAPGIGFTMTLAWLARGLVLTCSVPIPRPTVQQPNVTATAGCCFVINANGTVIATFRGNGINGPWCVTWLH